jgi:hypothetical protein
MISFVFVIVLLARCQPGVVDILARVPRPAVALGGAASIVVIPCPFAKAIKKEAESDGAGVCKDPHHDPYYWQPHGKRKELLYVDRNEARERRSPRGWRKAEEQFVERGRNRFTVHEYRDCKIAEVNR